MTCTRYLPRVLGRGDCVSGVTVMGRLASLLNVFVIAFLLTGLYLPSWSVCTALLLAACLKKQGCGHLAATCWLTYTAHSPMLPARSTPRRAVAHCLRGYACVRVRA